MTRLRFELIARREVISVDRLVGLFFGRVKSYIYLFGHNGVFLGTEY